MRHEPRRLAMIAGRYRRPLVAVVLAMSFLVATVVTSGWLLSYRSMDFGVIVSHGCFSVTTIRSPPSYLGWAAHANRKPQIRWLPFALSEPFGAPGRPRWIVGVPLWIPGALVFILAIVWFRECRRSEPGHCRKCRYNLAGNVSGVCPECGTRIETEQGHSSVADGVACGSAAPFGDSHDGGDD